MAERAEINATTIAWLKEWAPGHKSLSTARDELLARLIPVVSTAIEKHLRRFMKRKSRNEYFDVHDDQVREFFTKGVPITLVTSVSYDTAVPQTFSDALSTSNYSISGDGDSVRIVEYELQPGPRRIKIVYTGGLAESCNDVTVVMKTGGTGDYVVGETISVGGTAKGTVVSWASSTRTLVFTPVSTCVDVYYGGLAVNNVVTGTSATWTVDSFATSNLMHDYPDVAGATTLQVEYALGIKDHVGKTRIQVLDDSSYFDKALWLCPEAKELLAPYALPTIA